MALTAIRIAPSSQHHGHGGMPAAHWLPERTMTSLEASQQRWTYDRRTDGRIAVTLDSNVWNLLFEASVDLAAEFPIAQFALFVPREGEIEATAITKPELLEFIEDATRRAEVVTAAIVGFDTGERPQRMAPMGFGTFQSAKEAEIRAAMHKYLGNKQKGSGLYRNEGDMAVAVAAFSSIVVTAERPTKRGPLKFAFQRGGRIVYLQRGACAAGRLRERILACHHEAADNI